MRTTCCCASGSGRTAATPIGCATIEGSTSRALRRSRRAFPIDRTFSRIRSRSRTRSRVEFGKKYHLPAFPLPSTASSENELLTELATAGAKERYGDPLSDEVRQRLDYELGVITKTGYAGYFLIVVGLHQGGARPRHPRRAGPRLGRRLAGGVRAPHHRRLPAEVRSAVRAFSQSRARVDARRRRRLLLRAARRGDRVRAAEVREGVGLPDRDVRDDEVARRDQGRGPHARASRRRRRTRCRS